MMNVIRNEFMNFDFFILYKWFGEDIFADVIIIPIQLIREDLDVIKRLSRKYKTRFIIYQYIKLWRIRILEI